VLSGLPDTAQEKRTDSGYFAARNATWATKATPGSWNAYDLVRDRTLGA
jgi:hypothetical protein